MEAICFCGMTCWYEIEFDVIVDEIEVLEGDYHYDDLTSATSGLLRCMGDLDCSLDDFEINGIIHTVKKSKMPRPLSDALVPLIYKEELDNVVLLFQRYSPRHLKTPMAVDPPKPVEKMGPWKLSYRDITEDLSIFGQVFF